MEYSQFRVIIGSLMKDIGLIRFLRNSQKSVAEHGYDFLKDCTGDEKILDQIRYGGKDLREEPAEAADSLVYIGNMASTIASITEIQRKRNFGQDRRLESVYQVLNGNREKKVYAPEILEKDCMINFPADKSHEREMEFYEKIEENIKKVFEGGGEGSVGFIHALLSVLEANLSFFPSYQGEEGMPISCFQIRKRCDGSLKTGRQRLISGF